MINFKDFIKGKKETQNQSGQQQTGNNSDVPAISQNTNTQLNPFIGSQYANVNLPDTPIQFGGGVADSLLNNEEVPEEVRKKNWHIFHKDNVLTFLDEERKQSKMLNFDITKIDILNATPYYDYTFEKELELGILRNVFETKLDRAMGTKQNVKNERIILQSQFSEQRQIRESEGSNIRESFFKKLLSRR